MKLQRTKETSNFKDNDDDESFSSSNSESSGFSSSSSSLSDRVDAEQGYAPSSTFQRKGSAAMRRRAAPLSGNRSGSDDDLDPEDLIRRRNNATISNDSNGQHSSSHHGQPHHHRSSKRRKPRQSCGCVSNTIRACRKTQPTIVRHTPSIFLAGCFLFWLVVQTSNVYDSVTLTTQRLPGSVGQRNARLAAQGGKPPPPSQGGGTISMLKDAFVSALDIVRLPALILKKANRGEALPPGCVRSAWQDLNLQNCNDMHETDLYEAFTQPQGNGYVGSGYWRHVWLVDPRNEYHDSASKGGTVLKMMKSEHNVEPRNFERHRRDALAMERLTWSQHIVDIYSYCGNSVLTEYVGSDMHKVLYHAEDDKTPVSKEQKSPRSDRETLRLALDVVQGVADLHQVPGGPIVHADIADKQFLVDDQGRVKLNDFNRCRFMGHKKTTKEKCTFRIPSAPGRHRSPEEYEDEELTEQLDTYSTANVLYGILTGKEPWAEVPSSMLKTYVKRGWKPPIDDSLRVPGTTNGILASLIDQAYEHDFEARITAPQLAEKLKQALDEL
jgi:Protein tyrosine and serine/threonine kinase